MSVPMSAPVIVARADHPISRSSIDPDALKVLTRLHEANYTAYLVGGSVRDLLLDRRPKDFDVGTSAHPYQIKKLFRNCWIIGRRFRLAHVKFGDKAIEVATFRQHVPASIEPLADEPEIEREPEAEAESDGARAAAQRDLLIHRDNTFGTPEEDAFRRDFTVNALFYNIADRSIIDYVGGLDDIRARVIRSIGDPNERFQEDPVRMLRAVVLAARLDFTLDPPVIQGIREQRHLIATASPARLIEEYYKVLRSGAAEKTFRLLADHRLLETITPELHGGTSQNALWEALADLDRYRRRFESVPEHLTNPILLGTLLVPLGLMPKRTYPEVESYVERAGGRRFRRVPKEPPLRIGMLPVARRDTERLRQILSVQRRLADLESSPRAKRMLMHRGPFDEAMVWFEIHGHAPEALEHWRGFIEAINAMPAPEGETPPAAAEGMPPRRRRRGGRRRGRRRGRFEDPSGGTSTQ
jgi:poly(A) polymerase